VVGRGCLGRPWLFRDLADVFAGRMPEPPPRFGGVAKIMLRHANLLCDWAGERIGIRSFRKHATWYTKGFPDSARLRGELIRIDSIADLQRILDGANPELEFPKSALRVPRGKKGGRQKVALPEGYLDDRQDATPPGFEAEDATSGG
jgi:hypothetical protein